MANTWTVSVGGRNYGPYTATQMETFAAEGRLAPAYPVLPQAWIVSSEASVNAIRNALVQKLGKRDVLFVVDATHNRAAWFNFGPEADARIRRIWSRTPDAGRNAAE